PCAGTTMMKPARRRPARSRASVLAIGQAPRPRRRTALALRVEALEPRNLLSGPGSPLAEMEPNDTLDVAQSLGALGGLGAAEAVGTIGKGLPAPRTWTGIASGSIAPRWSP